MNCYRTVVITGMMILLSCMNAQAAVRRAQPGPARPVVVRPKPIPRIVTRPPAGARTIIVGGTHYWVYGGVYYRFRDNEYVVVSAPIIRVLPTSHRVVLVNDTVYYVVDGIYYQRVPEGYVVVDKSAVAPVKPAVVASKTIADQANTITLYVPKRKADGFVSVTLKKLETGYLAPQGEFYPEMPPISLLTELYGMAENLRHTRTDVYFIHVPNQDGESFTRVTLTKHKHGYLGPQGEFYPLMPSVAHLAELYGTTDELPEADKMVRLQVPKKNGEGVLDIELEKHEQGYLGPQGEFYPELPSANQLQEMYGGD